MKNKKKIEVNNSIEIINYQESLRFMEKRVVDIFLGKKPELIWFLNYDHIYTMGTSSKKKEIHPDANIPIFSTNRGGKTTYHGPGQRIVYFLINLNKRKKDIRKFVSIIENAAIEVLKDFDLEAKTFSDRIGIWVTKNKNKKIKKEEKIGAIGLRVKKWITFHGLSFNLDPELKYYNHIDACGLSGYSNTSMKKLDIKLSQKNFDRLFLKYFLKGSGKKEINL